MTQDYVSFSKIVGELSSLSKKKASGTMFISTRDNRSAQIMLEKGDIVYVFFSGKRGQDALDLMSSIADGRFRFQEGGVIPRRMQLPATQTILENFNYSAGQNTSSATGRMEKQGSTGNGLSEEQKKILEACLADCIGPMAAIVCEDHFASAGDIKSVIDALAGEIPSPGQVKNFREMVADRLG